MKKIILIFSIMCFQSGLNAMSNQDLNQQFLQYVMDENYPLVLDSLYNNLVDINVTDSEGRTALILAVTGQDEEMVKILLPFGPNRLIKDNTGKTALEHAINLRNLNIIKMLKPENIKESASSPEEEHKTKREDLKQQFLQHVMDEQYNKVFDLLKNGLVDIDTIDKHGKTALILAVLGQDEEMVEILLPFRPNSLIKDNTGKTALDYAINFENTNIINLLKKENVKYRPEYRRPSQEEKEKNEENLNSKFLNFVSNSKYEEVYDLLKKGLVDVNGILYYETFKRKKYTTALNAAINGSDIKMVEILLNYGADPYIKDSYNNDAFYYINQAGKHKVLEELLKKYRYKARTKQPKEQPKVTVKPKKVKKPILYISKEEAIKKLIIKDPSWVTLTDTLINDFNQLVGILDRDYKKTLKEDQELFEQGKGVAAGIKKIETKLTTAGKSELIDLAQKKFDEMNILNKIKNFMDDSGKKFIDKIFNDISNAEEVANRIPGAKEELRIVQSWKSGELQGSIKPYMGYIDGLALFTILREAFGMQGLK